METERSEWLSQDSPKSDTVVSCRIRLARNLNHMPFCHRAAPEELRRIVALVAPAVESCSSMTGAQIVPLDEITVQQRGMLVEEHVISKEHAGRKGGRAVVYIPGGKISVMVNEEDHIRIQSLESGLQLGEAYRRADELEEALHEQIEFAFNSTFGYLTACPTNVGTGMRGSAMIHMPGLALTKKLSDLLVQVSDKGFALRGFHGEGTRAFGDLYQMSNQTTLGVTENEIIETLEHEVNEVIELEERARAEFFAQENRLCEDLVWRAVGTLRQARIMSYEELMGLLSHVRLGIALGLLSGYDLESVNRLMIDARPVHIATSLGNEYGEIDPLVIDCARADIVRARFAQ